MSRVWGRGYNIEDGVSVRSGGLELLIVPNGATVLRSYWSFFAYQFYGSLSAFPPGAGVLRAGLYVDTSSLPTASIKNPIADPGTEWMDSMTIHPQVGFSTSTADFWFIKYSTPEPDKSVKAQRKNQTGAGQSLYVGWAFAGGLDTDPGFNITGYYATCDAYENLP